MTNGTKRRTIVLWGLGGGRANWPSLRVEVARTTGSLRRSVDLSADESAAHAAARALGPDHERRWGWLLRRSSRRALVVAGVATWALPIAGGFAVGDPFVGVALGFLLATMPYALLRQATRLITDLPDGYLDERQRSIRDESFTIAYKVLAGALAVTSIVAFIAAALTSSEGSVALPDIEVHWMLASVLSLAMIVQSLPAAVLAWREPEFE